jgi:thiol:disulfide interchange protein
LLGGLLLSELLASGLSFSGPLFSGLLSSELSACVPVPEAEVPEVTPVDWNAGEITWWDYFDGLKQARIENKPVILIFYTDWCPHCHNYSREFHDPEVVQLAHRFVMIRVERDGNREISARHDVDGDYVPRTFFLGPDAELLPGFETKAPRYRYFLDEFSPEALRARMRAAARASSPAPR